MAWSIYQYLRSLVYTKPYLQAIGNGALLPLFTQLAINTTLNGVGNAVGSRLQYGCRQSLHLEDPDSGAMSLTSIGGG
jgi:hypothetical protein